MPSPSEPWICSVDLMPKTPCTSSCQAQPTPQQTPVCATNIDDAITRVIQQWDAMGYVATIRKAEFGNQMVCYEWGFKMGGHPQYHPLDAPPSCDGTTLDNDCIACAKVKCCEDYQACEQDAACGCWVYCKASGNADETCALPENCGPLDAVSTLAAACLTSSCGGQCMTIGSMGSACMCGSTSSAGYGAPSCTPGPNGATEACLIDDDCASCSCNVQTQTCD